MPPSAAGSLTLSVTVAVNSLSDINSTSMSKESLYEKTELYEVRKLIKWMKSAEISVVFCSDSIGDDVVHLVASEGISTVSSSANQFLFSYDSFYLSLFFYLS